MLLFACFFTTLSCNFEAYRFNLLYLCQWQASTADKKAVMLFVSKLRLGTGATAAKPPCRDETTTKGVRMKIAECFVYCGPFGHAVIENMPSISRPYRLVYHLYLQMLTKLLYKNFSVQEIPDFHRAATVARAHAEIKFPVHFHQWTHHPVGHAWAQRGALHLLGPIDGWGMLGAERWGSFLKGLSHGCSKNIEESIHRNYSLALGVDLYRVLHPDAFRLAPLASQLSSVTDGKDFTPHAKSIGAVTELGKQTRRVVDTALRARVHMYTLSLGLHDDYKVLFQRFLAETGPGDQENVMEDFEAWTPATALSAQEEAMQAAPPLVASHVQQFNFHGIEYRANDMYAAFCSTLDALSINLDSTMTCNMSVQEAKAVQWRMQMCDREGSVFWNY